MRWALWTWRPRMVSARVGLPIRSCQRSTDTWLMISVAPRAVAILDQFQQVALLLRPEWLETPVIQDKELHRTEGAHQLGMAAVATGQAEIGEQPRHPLLEHGVVVAAGLLAEGAGQPGLPDPGRAHDILPRNSRSTSASTTRITRVLGNACWCCARSIMPALGILRSRCRAERMAFCPNG